MVLSDRVIFGGIALSSLLAFVLLLVDEMRVALSRNSDKSSTEVR